MKGFTIRNTQVGPGSPCFIVAEAGSNHNGDLGMARELVQVAAKCGADAVKFQTFKANRLYPKSAGKSDYLGVDTSIYDIIKAMEMPEEWLSELCELTHALDMAFISSPFHEEAVDLLDPYVDAFKIASYELTHEPLLRAVAARKKPIIISTGASTVAEARDAVLTLRRFGAEDLVVLQCTAAYPAPPESVQVRALVHLRKALGVLTGLSDHSENPALAPIVAASLGANLVEKHFTLSKSLPGPDHAFAIEPQGLAAMVEGIRGAEQVRGHGRKEVHPVEAELRSFARRSIFTTRPIRAGEPFTVDNVDVLRQGKLGQGLAPRHMHSVLGACAATDLAADTPLQPEDVRLSGEGVFQAPPPSALQVELRPAKEADLGMVWVWANDPVTRAASLNSDAIPYSTHQRWFENSLSSPHRHLWIGQHAGDPVAVVRLDRAPGEPPELSIHVAPDARDRGLGRACLIAAAEEGRNLGLQEIGAAIRPDNQRSIRAFTAVGFQPSGQRTINGQRIAWYTLAL